MEHLTVKAVATATELGEFTAIAATYDIDRVKDQIVPGAFAKTIAQWRASGQLIPVDWAHSRDAKDIIGAVNPASMREIPDEGLYVKGKLDLQDSEVAREAWRVMKANAVALSFGYLATDEKKRRDGTNELREIDLFAITIATAPINPNTRFVSMKAIAERNVPTDADQRRRWVALKGSLPCSSAELRQECDRLRVEILTDGIPRHDPEPAKPTERELRKQWDQHRVEMALDGVDLETIRAAPHPGPVVPTDAELREQAKALGLHVPRPREGTAERFHSGLDPTAEQLVKDLNAAYDRAEAIHRPRSRARASRSE